MRTIIAGSRENVTLQDVFDAIDSSNFYISTVLSGTAKGADKFGEIWAECADIPIERYPANWDKYGKSAGYIRNEQMAENASALIAVWDGKSKGTMHMIAIAASKGLKMYVHTIG